MSRLEKAKHAQRCSGCVHWGGFGSRKGVIVARCARTERPTGPTETCDEWRGSSPDEDNTK